MQQGDGKRQETDKYTKQENQPLTTKCQGEMGQDGVGAARTQAAFTESRGGEGVQISGERGRISSFIPDRRGGDRRGEWRRPSATGM